MTWQTEMVQLVRTLINDLGSVTYSDATLKSFIVGSAQLLLKEVDFDTTYTIDLVTPSISPDPTTQSPKDDNFINTVCLKASVLILFGELKTAAAEGIRVTDGPSTIDMTGAYASTKGLYDTLLQMFERSKIELKMGNAGKVVITPFKLGG